MAQMKKLFNIKIDPEKLKRERKRIKRRSILLAFFLLGVNAFAWFTYISKADLSIKGNIVSWDVNFLDQNSIVKVVEIIVDDLQPGMLTFSKQIDIFNKSDVKAKFEYQINKVTILGQNITSLGTTNSEIMASLKSQFPFVISLIPGKTDLAENDQTEFKVTVDWPYEQINTYYKLNSLYKYDESVTYYTLQNGVYTPNKAVTASNFSTLVASGLYLEKDDADSFWGSECHKYKQTHPTNSCLNIDLNLIVSQLDK